MRIFHSGTQTPSPPAKALQAELIKLEGNSGLGSPTAGRGQEPMETEHRSSEIPADDVSIDDYIEPGTPLAAMDQVDNCGDAAMGSPVLDKDYLAPEHDEHVPGFVFKKLWPFIFWR